MTTTSIHIDVCIIGGGISGLWLLNLLGGRGYSVVLLESGRLGEGQTLASQGLIHGGLKYALGGALTAASEVMAAMPGRWRACLAGSGEIDLSPVRPLSDHFHFFGQGGAWGALTAFFTSRLLRGRIEKLGREEFPPLLKHQSFNGLVYRVEDFVLDPHRLIKHLASLSKPRIYQAHQPIRMQTQQQGASIETGGVKVACKRLILAAGAGNEALLKQLRIPVAMQLRPLHQVVVRHPGVGPFFGHCLTAMTRPEPRLTITSHADEADSGDERRWLWSVGGQLATAGAKRSRTDQRRQARSELSACLPWIDWNLAEIDCFSLDRAEPRQPRHQRPDAAFVESKGACLVCWPTKLSLAPDLGDRVLALLPPPEYAPFSALDLPPAEVGAPPWAN